MIDIVRDTWRAVLALVVGTLLLEASSLRRPEPQPAPTVAMNHYQPMPMAPVWQPAPQPERPLRRVAAAITELGDSFIGVVR
jgi:hypothetical protein